MGNYKLFRFYEDESLHLFDLNQDIGERNNLANEKPDIVDAMAARMNQYLADVGAEFPTKNPDYDPNKPSTLGSAKKKGNKGKGKGKGNKKR